MSKSKECWSPLSCFSQVALWLKFLMISVIDDLKFLLSNCGTLPHFRTPAIICLGISASKFIDASKNETACLDNFLRSNPTETHKAPSTATKPEDDTTQSQRDKGNATKRNSLDFFFSPSQSVTSSQLQDDNKLTQQSKEVGVKKQVQKKHSLEHFFTPSQRTENKSPSEIETEHLGMNGSESTPNKNVRKGKTTEISPGTSFFKKKSARGFFAKKLQENSIGTEVNEDTNYDDNDVEVRNAFEENVTELDVIEEPSEFKADNTNDASFESRNVLDNASVPSTSTKPVSHDHVSEQPIPTSDEVLCEKCKQIISVWEYPEHLDYHFALELQNQTEIPSVDISKKQGPTSGVPQEKMSGKRRGRPPGPSSKKAKIDSGSATIHSFFKPK